MLGLALSGQPCQHNHVRLVGGFDAGRVRMKALTWQGKGTIRCETVPDPVIEHGRDVIIKVSGFRLGR